MIFTGRYIKIAESRCKCGEIIDKVEVVITLRGDRDNPTEYSHACPECCGLDTFTEIEETDDAIGQHTHNQQHQDAQGLPV